MSSDFVINDRSDEAFRQMVAINDEQMARDFMENATELAKEKAPHLTGNLASSIRFVRLGPLHYRLQTETGYGVYPELGTAHMAAQPYIIPAVVQSAKEFAPKKAD